MKRTLRPKTPKPTTPSPITDPPENAISNAFPRLSLAALVVRTFALVATFIPIKPASPEKIAPNINEKATRYEDVSLLAVNANNRATTITKMDNTLYSALRNAIAPSAMFVAIRPIFSVPTSCLETQEERMNVNSNATIPKTGMM